MIFKIVTVLLMFFTLANARMIGGVAVVVDGEPITTGEIKRFQAISHLDKKRATDLLIQKRLEEKAIKDANIFVNDVEIDEAMSKIAQQNGVSVDKLKKEIQKQGLSMTEYRKNLSDRIKKEKFLAKVMRGKMKRPDEVAIKAFYNSNKEKFKIPGTIDVVEYSAKDGKYLAMLLRNPMLNLKEVHKRDLKIDPRRVNPQLLELLKKTPDSKFTPIINTPQGFVTFFIKTKNREKIVPFDKVKPQIEAMLMQQEQNRILNEYFEKRRSEAIVKVIRK